MTTDAEKFSSGIARATEATEPVCTSTHNGRANSNCFDVCHSCGATPKAGVGWKWRLHAGLSRLALKGLNKSTFLTTNISTSTSVNINIKVISSTASVLTEESLSISFIDCLLKLYLLIPELASNIDVSSLSTHAETNDECTFDKFVRVVSHDLSIFASTWL